MTTYQDGGLAALLESAAAGEQAAWAELVRRFGSMLTRMSRQRGLSAEEAADAAQRTWLLLFTNAHRIREPERLPGWLATTVAREAQAVRRRAVREIPADGSELERTDDSRLEEGLVDQLDAARRRQQLLRAVSRLPTRERALVEVLLDPAQPSYAEISARLGMPVGAIGPVRQRALRRLRMLIDTEERPAGTPVRARERLVATA